jgi:hypothetical protein
LTALALGTCSITASQAGDTTTAAARNVVRSITIAKLPQTITFTGPTGVTVSTTPQTLSATSSAGGSYPVSFATSSAACSISGTTLTVVSAGTCSITASQAGDTTTAAASNVVRSITIAKLPQTITFTAPTAVTVSTTPQSLSATSSAGGSYPVSFATSSAACTIDGTTLTVVSAGPCSITASQAGDTTTAAARNVVRSITIMQPQATLLVANSNDSNIAKGASGITLSVSGGSGTGAISYRVSGAGCSYSSSTKVLSVASSYKPGVTVSCSVTATQGSSGTYLAATSVAKAFNFR